MKTLVVLLLLAGCHEANHSTYNDAGLFKNIGDSCAPDLPPDSECGYAPRAYCASSGVCASACNGDDDCVTGTCIGATATSSGECRLMGDGGARSGWTGLDAVHQERLTYGRPRG